MERQLLPELLAEAKARAEVGRSVLDGAPLPVTQREAVRYLAHRLYLRSSMYRDQVHQADTAGLDPDVAEFVQAYMRFMAGLGVPVHVDVAFRSRADHHRLFVLGHVDDLASAGRFASGRDVAIVHSVRGRSLPAICWGVFEHVGAEVGSRLGLKVQWGGHAEPWHWSVDP